MCGYGDYREQVGMEEGMKEGMEEGMKKGMKEGKEEGIKVGKALVRLRNIRILHKNFPEWSFEYIMEILEIPHEERTQYLKLLTSTVDSKKTLDSK